MLSGLQRWWALVVLCGAWLWLSAAAAAERPNVLVIMADDLGYGDLSCYGGADVQTPHVDRLAAEGMRFTEFYANGCVCTPSRGAFLSGRYPEFVGLPGVVRTHAHNSFGYLDPNSMMLSNSFQKAGYRTVLIGKWHLGLTDVNLPNNRGFDDFHGFLGDMMDDYWTHDRHGINYMRKNEETIATKGHATDVFTDWAIAALHERAQSEQPFFMFLAYNAPHDPIHPEPEWVEKIQAREPGITKTRVELLGLIEHMDDAIGRVMTSLDELGLSENTIVVFTSDNGGKLKDGANNGGLREGKANMYEGGLKVPTCIRWPQKIAPGQTTEFRALTMDLLPTMAAVCDVPITQTVDGASFQQLLENGKQKPFDRPVFHIWRQKGIKHCVRVGDWKLLRNSWKANAPYELYNVAKDPGEKQDLIKRYPERAQELRALLDAHMKEAAQVPWQPPGQN